MLDLGAFIALAVKITIYRKGTAAAQSATEFLDLLCPELVFACAMMADAADEVLLVIRHFDDEGVDSSKTTQVLHNFMDRIHYLFVLENVLKVEGHTKIALRFLSRPHVYEVNGTVKCIGGVVGDAVRAAADPLKHLKTWCVLAFESVLAEFPSFETMQAMRIFNSIDTDHPDLQQIDGSLVRLAHVFRVPETQLRVEFLEAQQCARQQFKRCGSDTPLRQLWVDGIRDRYRDGVQKQYIKATLRQILCRFLAWSISTSGLECRFSAAAEKFSDKQLHCHESTESNFYCLLAVDTKDEALVQKIVDGARQVYVDVYGDRQARRHDCHSRPRSDKGIKNLKRGTRPPHSKSYKRFIANRRNSVAMSLQEHHKKHPGCGRTQLKAFGASLTCTDKENKEIAHLREKAFKRKCLALDAGEILPTEANAELYQGWSEMQKRIKTSFQSRTRDALNKRARLKLLPPTREEFKGATCYIDSHVDDSLWTPQISSAFIDLQIQPPSSLTSASFCFVANPLNLMDVPATIQWRVVLAGGWLLSPSALVGQFSSLRYFRATSTRRYLWVSEEFQDEEPGIWHIIETACEEPGSHWTLLPSIDEFVLTRTRYPKDPARCLGLVSQAEKSMPDFNIKHVHDKDSMFKFIARRDCKRGTGGAFASLV